MKKQPATTIHFHRRPHRTLSRRTAIMGLGATGTAALLAAARPLPALGPRGAIVAGQEREFPELVITGTEFAFDLPAEVPGGLTRVTLVNEGAMDHHAIFLLLADGVTGEDVAAAAENPDPTQLVSLGQMLGGPNGAPPGGGSATVILDLVPGNHEVVCAIPDEEGIPHYVSGMIAPLTVTEQEETPPAPEADLTVNLVDFEFHDLPAEVPSGAQLWEAVNTGEEPHELVILKLTPGVDFDTALGMFTGEMPMQGDASPGEDAAASPAVAAMAPPFALVTGTAPMNPGMTNWLVLDLEPGDYGAICLVPSPANNGLPHLALGMAMPFTVA